MPFAVEPPACLLADLPSDPAVLPPGWYMLFILDAAGVPSPAWWMRIS